MWCNAQKLKNRALNVIRARFLADVRKNNSVLVWT